MTRSEVFGYPLIIFVSAGLLIWGTFSGFRGDMPASIDISTQLYGVLMLLLGFFLFPVLNAITASRSRRTDGERPSYQSFNPALIHEVIHLLPAEPVDVEAELRHGEVTSASLVGRDNALALAKVRLDLEETLREIALAQGIDIRRRGTGAKAMAMVLADHDVLPHELVEPIHQIVAVCNRAIHGDQISDDLAESTVSVGDELLSRLRWLSESKKFVH